MRLGLGLLMLSGAISTAHAAHPLVTDDTGTQDTGNYQLEINADRVRQSSSSSTINNFTFTYGAASNLDIFVNTPMAWSSPSGMGDAALGAKWRFFDNKELSFALEPALQFPTGDENKSLGTGRPGLATTLIGNWTRGPWTLQGNLAVGFNRYGLQADRDVYRNTGWRVSTAVRYALSEQWQLVGDIGLFRNIEIDSHGNPGYALVGTIYSPIPTLDLDAGLKFGLGCGDCATQIHRQFGVGLTWRF